MSELAYNADGVQFTPPLTTAAWRVRRCKKKGAPEIVYGGDGVPLSISVDAGIEDLRTEVSEPGRYRLDPVDEEQRPIADATPAYVVLKPETAPLRNDGAPMARDRFDALESVLTEVMRSNIEANRASLALGQTIVERFAGVMESASVLVRAVGAVPVTAAPAGVVESAPLVEAVEGEQEDVEAAPQGLDLNALVAQVVTSLVTAVCNGQMKLPAFGSLLDWRRAAPTASIAPEPPSSNAAPSAAPGAASSSTTTTAGRSTAATSGGSSETPAVAVSALALAALSPAAMGQLMAVQQALAPEERALALAVIRELPPSELQVWAQELAKLPLEGAVAKIREVLQRAPAEPTGGVS